MKQSVTTNNNNVLQAEINAFSKELDIANKERERERELLNQQIDFYKERLERADKDKDQLTALLTNQEEGKFTKKKRFWKL